MLPNQIIDRTKGIRKSTFFEGTGVVAHASFGDPFTNPLIDFLETHIRTALQGKGVKLHTGKCIICMEGPQFSTRAESLMYRAWGGDLINMSVLPEAKLAREAELGYAPPSLSPTVFLYRLQLRLGSNSNGLRLLETPHVLRNSFGSVQNPQTKCRYIPTCCGVCTRGIGQG